MTNRRAAWLTAGFVAYLAALSLWSIAQPDRKLSEFENRALQQFLPSPPRSSGMGVIRSS